MGTSFGSGSSAGACDGEDALACAYPASDTVCGEPRCDSAMFIDDGACDRAGACADPPAMLCEHGCEGGACLDCVTNEHGAASEVCAAGACVMAPPLLPGNCGCRVASRRDDPRPTTTLLALAALALVVGHRRRRRRRA